jgi:hypothetical protein
MFGDATVGRKCNDCKLFFVIATISGETQSCWAPAYSVAANNCALDQSYSGAAAATGCRNCHTRNRLDHDRVLVRRASVARKYCIDRALQRRRQRGGRAHCTWLRTRDESIIQHDTRRNCSEDIIGGVWRGEPTPLSMPDLLILRSNLSAVLPQLAWPDRPRPAVVSQPRSRTIRAVALPCPSRR